MATCSSQASSTTTSDVPNTLIVDHLKKLVETNAVEKCYSKQERDELWGAALEVYFATIEHLAENSKDKDEKELLTRHLSLRSDPSLALSNTWLEDYEELENTICALANIRKSYPTVIGSQIRECEQDKAKLATARAVITARCAVLDVDETVGELSTSRTSEQCKLLHSNVFPNLMSKVEKFRQSVAVLQTLDANPADMVLFELESTLPTTDSQQTVANPSTEDEANSPPMKSMIPVPKKVNSAHSAKKKQTVDPSRTPRRSLRLTTPRSVRGSTRRKHDESVDTATPNKRLRTPQRKAAAH